MRFDKIVAAVAGFTACLVAAPLLAVVLPFFAAWFLYNEKE